MRTWSSVALVACILGVASQAVQAQNTVYTTTLPVSVLEPLKGRWSAGRWGGDNEAKNKLKLTPPTPYSHLGTTFWTVFLSFLINTTHHARVFLSPPSRSDTTFSG
jgi:hypothetical protein